MSEDQSPHAGGVDTDEILWDADDELEQQRGAYCVTKYQQKQQMALFLLKTKEIKKLSQVALEEIIEEFTLILQESIRSLREKVNI